ncbi:aminotransferase class V-fold PLP-dependent enzyme [Sphaerisporangium perillae]|uniref:aminotransferase class V-fold PLP-dependent enzyme n=1 Tax=Sphaerisporangium perillae TaxID=2935860 RepID=UPI00200CE6E3|nr:aminotransferase class V-fold PLP-dependent enzyme [Sphaerisporangium perillae]
MTAPTQSPDLATRVRHQFPGTGSGVYLNSAAESLFLGSHVRAMNDYAARKNLGARGRDACAEVEAHCRALAGELLSVDGRQVAFLASTSRGLDAVIKTIRWMPGDNIVFAQSEFPSTAFAAVHLAELGVERRVVTGEDGLVPTETYAAQMDERTRLVVASLVSYENGFLVDLPALAAAAHERGALLFVDAVQAAGAVPFDAGVADFLCAGTYKWLLGAHGLAIFYVNPDALDRLAPPYVAYRGVTDLFAADRLERFELYPDARRFEEGMPNYLGLHVLENALEFVLSIGVEAIASHNAELVAVAMQGLADLGVAPLTPREPGRRGSIVSFATSREAEITRRLGEHGVSVWGRDGRVRISPHIYNTVADVQEFLRHLAPVLNEVQQ